MKAKRLWRGFIVKFTEPKYVSQVAQGTFHCTNISYFWNLEENEIKGIKDKHEGRLVRNIDPATSVLAIRHLGSTESPQVLTKVSKLSLVVKYERTKQIAISSFVALSLDDDFTWNSNAGFVLKPDVFACLEKQFCGRPAVLFPAETFIKMLDSIRICQYPEILQLKYGRVNYRHGFSEPTKDDWNFENKEDKNLIDLAFEKDEFYSGQREFRIAVVCRQSQDINISTAAMERHETSVANVSELENFSIKFVG